MRASPASPVCIHRLFEAQASATPEAVAIRFRGETLTYADLDARANRVAHHLRALGAGPEVAVGVLLPRTPELIATLLGVLKTGGAYVPLDPAYPPERVAYMLADTRVPVLVTDAERAALAEGFTGHVVRIDAEAGEIAGRPSTAPEVECRPENLAYVIYTSGSTGRPKGVQIEHRSTAAVLGWLRRTLSDEERSAVLASTSVCFDVSIAEIFGTLCWGGAIVLVDNALSLIGLEEPVVTACMVPSAAAELERMGAIPPCVRVLGLGGEPVRPELGRRLHALGHVRRVLNLYGPTEDTTYSTCKEIEPDRAGGMTVGWAVDGTTVRVLDEDLDPVADGETGEVWMSGAGLARGYLGAPAMTAERFRPDPHAGVPGARMYRTGDLGRFLDGGELECLGRIDHQVKVRGYRVEPGEVETALLAHPAVAQAAVAPWSDRGETRLAAYVVPALDVSSIELREFVRGRLPEYMVPDAVVFLPELPHTPSGKVDRLALPVPDPARDAAAESVAPRNETEAVLAEIWAEVLGAERVGVRDDFFALGGHSLRAAQIAARVRQRMGAELPLTALFAMPTVEELARRIAATQATAERTFPRADRDRPIPLSYPQEAIWFFEALSPGMRSYNFQATVRVSGTLHVDVLERALAEIVRRHEIFRTTFPAVDGAPVQVVHDPWPVHLPVEDLRSIPGGEREETLQRRLVEEFRRPFDLSVLPLVRWSLFRLAEDEHVFLVVEQHLVHDGWSFGVFLKELTALYTAFARGEPSPLAEPSIQYADFAAWQRGWMETPEAREQLEWWRKWLEGVPPVLEIPADRPRPAAMSFRGSGLRLRLPRQLYERADAFSRARGVTLYMTLLAAFQALLHRYTGETDFCVGSGVADRRTKEAEELIGMVVNTLPLRADVAGDPPFAALVDRVRDAAMGAYARQDVPFAEIVNAVHPERSRGHLPVFQVAFSFHHAPYPEMALPGATIEVAEGLGNESAKFDLNIVVIPRAQQGAGDEVVMIWEWAEDLFDRETVRRMVAHYEEILAGALDDPSLPVSRVRMVPEEESHAVAAWGAAPVPYPRDATVPALFAEQARRAPDAVAITHGARRMTYAELDAAAARVARRLREMGIGPESVVAVAMDRSPEMMAAFLGTLRAGAAYLPLDTGYPAERLSFMLEDAGAAALVVSNEMPEPLRAFSGPVLSLADLASGDNRELEDDREMAFAESAACVIYTSGSTGRPKGVAIPHRGIVRLVRGDGATQIAAGDVVGQGSTVSFDAALWEVWSALLNGARVAILDRDEMLAPDALARRLREEGVTALFVTASLFKQISAEAPDALSGLRLLVTGGEAADPAAFRRVLEMGARAPRLLVNAYGPTEGTTYSTEHVAASAGAGAVPIGRPVPNSRVYVLDGEMRPVPAGVPGELYVGGDGLARGYVARPALTAERFVPDPVSGDPGARLYRTGDRVRWRAEGALEFLGRMDDQVKVRGFRVEPGEIEAALRAHPAVADAAVVARPDAEGVQSLAAYVVPGESAAPDAADLRAFLATRLPPYMIPSAYAVLDAFPLTPSGKVDRRRLPEPGTALPADAPAAPETATESALVEIWREVLELERVGADDNFFDLGGHSLRATRIVSRVEARLGVKISVGSLFDYPTVRGLARLVDERTPAPRGDEELLAWIEGLSEEEAERLLSEGR